MKSQKRSLHLPAVPFSFKSSIFLVINPNFISWGAKWMTGGPNGPGLTPQKPLILAEKMLRLLEIFLRKNSSPFYF